MTVDDLKAHFGCKTDAELMLKTGVSDVTLWKWAKQGIPVKTQCFFEIKTNGGVRADRKLIA